MATFRDGLPLGRIAGAPVTLAYSWFIIAIFIVVMIGPVVERAFPIGIWAYVVAFCYALLLLFSVLVHELAHAFAGRSMGWPTQKIVLNIWGGHTQFENFRSTPGRSLFVALAGPAANLFLALLAWGVQGTLPHAVTVWQQVLYALLDIFVLANMLIAVFNLLPGLPLDGGRLVESLVWRITGSQERGVVAAAWAGRVVAIVLAAVLLYLQFSGIYKLPITSFIFCLVVAGFLWAGAGTALKEAKMRLKFPGLNAGKLASPAVPYQDSATVAELRAAFQGHEQLAVILTRPDGTPYQVVDPEALATVPEQLEATTPASAVAMTIPEGNIVFASTSGVELIHHLGALPGKEYVVLNDRGSITGILREKDVLAALE